MENRISIYRLSPKEIKLYANFEIAEISKLGLYNIQGVDKVVIKKPYEATVTLKAKDLFKTTSLIADKLEEYGEVVNYVN